MGLIVPQECRQNGPVSAYLDELVAGDNAIEEVLAFDLKQSMSNGGGPACLRLRVVLNVTELAAVNPACMMNQSLFDRLMAWLSKVWREDVLEVTEMTISKGAMTGTVSARLFLKLE